MPVLVTCKFEKNLIKNTEKRWRHRFPYYKSMGASCCHGNQSSNPICPKTLCNLSPTLMMLHIKFDQHWPTGLKDVQVSSELWQNDRILEGQGKSSIAPTFSKQGYKYGDVLKIGRCGHFWQDREGECGSLPHSFSADTDTFLGRKSVRWHL